jgi:hypothetical protein
MCFWLAVVAVLRVAAAMSPRVFVVDQVAVVVSFSRMT